MNKRNSTLSIAAILAASALAFQPPIAGAQSADAQRGVPGVEVNIGDNASDRGLPGVEMNIGRNGDQNDVTRRLGAGAGGEPGAGGDAGAAARSGTSLNADDESARSGTEVNSGGSVTRPMRADRG